MRLLRIGKRMWYDYRQQKQERGNKMALQYTDEMTGEEYNELRLSVEWPPITEGQAERGLAHTTFLVAARDGERIVGMGRMLFDFGYTAYLGDVIVRPEYQGQGKEPFYEKFGFIRRPNEFSGDGMSMWRKK